MNKKELKEVIVKLQAMETELTAEEERNKTAACEAQQSDQSEYTDPTEENTKKVYNLTDNATCLVELKTGKSTVTINDIGTSETLLGLAVSHVFNPDESNSCYGANFKLNLYEKLEVVEGLDERFDTPVYTDATGTKYTFNVLTCYETDGKRNILNDEGKQKITGTKGNYMYNGSTVFPDYIPVGMYDYEGEFETKHPDLANGLRWIRAGAFHKGFDSEGKLVFIEDEYGKYKLFTYENGKITKINDGNGNSISFSYDGVTKKLNEITDCRNRSIKYQYDGSGCLTQITYYDSDGVVYNTLTLSYTQIRTNDKYAYAVGCISCSDNYFTSINYDKPNLIDSKTSNISYYDSTLGTQLISQISFSLNGNSATITDDDDNAEMYAFNADGSITEYYETTNNLVTYAELCSYEPLVKYEKTVISDEFLNKYTYDEFKSSEVQSSIKNATHEYTVTEFNEFNEPKNMTVSNICVTDNSTKKIYEEYVYTDRHVLRLTTTWETYSDGTSFMYNQNRTFNENGELIQQSYAPYHVDGRAIYDYLENQTYTYDSNGCVAQIKRTREDPFTGSASKNTFYSDIEYDSNKRLVREYDERKTNYHYYYYKNKTNLISQLVMANSAPISYTYTSDDKLNSLSALGGSDVQHFSKNEIMYENGEVSSVSDKNSCTKIEYTYDAKRRPATITLNGVTYETYEYTDNAESSDGKYDKVKLTNANGENFTAKAFKDGKKQELYCGEEKILERNFNEKGLLTEVKDNLTNNTIKITYDTCGNVLSCADGANKETYTLNTRGQVTKVVHTGDVVRTDEYKYAGYAEDYVKTVMTGAYKVYVNKDLEYRYTGKSVYVNGTKIDDENVTYLKNGDRDTHLPNKISFNDDTTTYEYTYDIKGNISTIKKDGEIISMYTYDGLNRLIRDDFKAMNMSTCYTYDGNGNIIKKSVSSFSLGSFDPSYEKGYKYDEHNRLKYTYWIGHSGDETLFMNEDEPCEYDDMGNPLKYYNGEMVWTRGRKLVKYGNNTFEYDAQGRRTKKNNITFTYDSQGRLIKQSNGLEFFYDTTGLLGFTYQGNTYYYRKDIQGNIIAILDSNGTVVVEYSYDPWGKHTVSGSNTTLGYLNPFRYRSYYFDTETYFYYLETRYYDYRLGRFINMDSLDYADPTYFNGLNLYAYCNNNPIKLTNTILKPNAVFKNMNIAIGNSGNSTKVLNSLIISGNKSKDMAFRISANTVKMENYSVSLINSYIANFLIGNISHTVTTQLNSPEFFYAFSNIGNDGSSWGFGIHPGDWFDCNFYVSDGIGFGSAMQVTPLFTVSGGVSIKDGITMSFGIINDDTTQEISVNLGWGTITGLAIAGSVSMLPIPGARIAGALIALCSFIFG